jgi:hypothetical protein
VRWCVSCRVFFKRLTYAPPQGEIEDFSKCIELKLRLNPFDAYNAYNNRGLAYQVTSTSRACTCVRSCVLPVCVCMRHIS